ncbi:hypothetical protein B0H67DRAFT_99834 [Lasiosphaeris hirsuta]|uniref:Uncharacterized protein n=1 Tax=Lasiosphaeris hirsuta TaxID=260670 RepID=A0AA40AY31_9PEZI|nr:hypothetical protein B0H67DRAFT_99834 [Lasiosphaeris hirsuta]
MDCRSRYRRRANISASTHAPASSTPPRSTTHSSVISSTPTKTTTKPAHPPRHPASGIIVPHMKLIDCSTRTIVAAHGPGPIRGLPGVSPARHRIYGYYTLGRVGSRLLASGPIHNRQLLSIETSLWNTRAWTF